MLNKRHLSNPERIKRAVRVLVGAIGPGTITGAADDDPSGIGTYTVAGAQFGTAFLWTALITWPLMAAAQMACARIGMVTGDGLAMALKKKLPRPALKAICAALFCANAINVGADLSAMADAAELLTGFTSHVWVVAFGGAITFATVRLRYSTISRSLKWLVLSLFAYVIVAFISRPEWSTVVRDTFVPSFPRGHFAWSTIVAILGTTISPYLFFWQASQEIEEQKAIGLATPALRKNATPRQIALRKFDVGVGTFFSNLVMYFIILAAAATLHAHGLTEIQTSADAAKAFEPLAGRFAATIYAAGLVGSGFLAIPTLTGSAAYALAETFGWEEGIDAKFSRARAFYAVILAATVVAVGLDFMNFNPIAGLYWTAVLNGLLAPILLTAVFFVIRDPQAMEGQPSSRLGQAMVATAALAMYAAALGMFFF